MCYTASARWTLGLIDVAGGVQPARADLGVRGEPGAALGVLAQLQAPEVVGHAGHGADELADAGAGSLAYLLVQRPF